MVDKPPTIRGVSAEQVAYLSQLFQDVLRNVLPPEGSPGWPTGSPLIGVEPLIRATAMPVDLQGPEFRIMAGDKIVHSGTEGTSSAGQVNLGQAKNPPDSKLIYINDAVVLHTVSAGPIRVRLIVDADPTVQASGINQAQRLDTRLPQRVASAVGTLITDGGANAPLLSQHLCVLSTGAPSLVIPLRFVLHPGGIASFYTQELAVSLGLAIIGRSRRILSMEIQP